MTRGLAFRDHELEGTVPFLANAQHRDRAFLDLELHASPGARFAVILLQAADDRFGRGDVDVVRAVVTHKHAVALKVDRVKLRKAAPDIEAVHDHHCHAGLDIELATHRESRAGQEGIAHDQVGHQRAKFGTGLAFIVVGEAIETLFLDQAFEGDCCAGSGFQVAIRQLFGQRIALWVRCIEELEDLLFPFGNRRLIRGAVVFENLTRLNEHDVRSKCGSDRGGIGVHVEHGLEHVAHQTNPCLAQGVEGFRNATPALEFLGNNWITGFMPENYGRRLATKPHGNTRELWN